MKLQYPILLISIIFSNFSFAQSNDFNDNSQTFNRMQNKIDSLERRIERLEDKIDMLQNQSSFPAPPNNTSSKCSDSDYVKLLKNNNFAFPVAENLCPYQCAKLLMNYQKTDPRGNYQCVR